MALSIATDLVTLSDCDAAGTWSPTPDEDAVMQIQGLGCLAEQVKATTGDLNTLAITSADMTGKGIFICQQVAGLTDTQVNGGMTTYAAQGANSGIWKVGGGLASLGWNFFVFSPGSTPSTPTGTIDESAIDTIGLQFKTLTTVVGSTTMNCFWDACRYGSYLQATSLSTDAFGLEDIYLIDSNSSNVYGIMLKSKYDSYVQQGKIIYGNVTSGDCDFTDTAKILIFPDNPFVEAGFYNISVVGNSATVTNFDLSESTIKSNGIPFIFDASDSNIDVLSLVGNTIVNCGSALFTAIGSVLSNKFSVPGLIEPGTCTFAGNTLADGAAKAVKIVPGHNTSGNTYSNNYTAIIIDTAGTYTIDGDQFSGNTYDIENASTGLVTINVVGGSNLPTDTYINTNGGTTVINISVPINVLVLDDSTSLPIESAHVQVLKDSDKSVILSTATDINGEISDTYSGTTPEDYVGWVRQTDLLGIDYVQKDISGTITTAGLSITVRLLPI